MVKKWALSFRVSRDQPSATLAGIDTAARVICDRIPYRYSLGSPGVRP